MKREFSIHRRSSGILLHLTSLPGPHGIGDLGPDAYRFADFLSAAGQRWWQMLPVVPLANGNSPYNSTSAFAGNPLLISLDSLVREGLLKRPDVRPVKSLTTGRVNYAAVKRFKSSRLRKAFRAFCQQGGVEEEAFHAFCESERDWLPDYALFIALKTHFEGRPWGKWPEGLRLRKARAMQRAREMLAEEIRYNQFLQYVFFRQWRDFRTHCHKVGVGLIGDIPIYVSLESADVWANPDLFHLDTKGKPTMVAGVPPDYFSEDGQLWGNPLYRWNVLKRRKYSWWVRRIGSELEKFNAIRLDHFIGFQRYWVVSNGERTAKNGHWAPGPRADFFRQVLKQVGPAEFIAEDLGAMTPAVTALCEKFGFPGMRVLQFEFGPKSVAARGRAIRFPKNCVLYTGTHDNDTILGWFHDKRAKPGARTHEEMRRERDTALACIGSDGSEFHWDMIRYAFKSNANLVIIPLQDVLGLTSLARMNRPGTVKGNWTWRFPKSLLKEEYAHRLLKLAEACNRLGEL